MFDINRESVWINPKLTPYERANLPVDIELIDDAAKRLDRFKPFIAKRFPETNDGTIESPLRIINGMSDALKKDGAQINGTLLLKMDSHLAIAGSVKARGGVYEVLKHTEDLALNNGIITLSDNYVKLCDYRDFFSGYKLQVGSTGNLGLSIGISGAAVGYEVTVHMSRDAKQWKKELLKKHGVHVIEYENDYSEAVRQGRVESEKDPMSYFVDDEKSVDLFLGYAVAAKRLDKQLDELGINISAERPLFVYLPCGVGGAPGGIAYGLKAVYGDNVHAFFIEPVQSPCVLLGMATGLNEKVSVKDYGLTGITQADGLAVGTPSAFVCRAMENLLSGGFTVSDENLFRWLKLLHSSEGITIEPSACAAFAGVCGTEAYEQTRTYIDKAGLKMQNAVHIAWATGGSLVPDEVMQSYIKVVVPCFI